MSLKGRRGIPSVWGSDRRRDWRLGSALALLLGGTGCYSGLDLDLESGGPSGASGGDTAGGSDSDSDGDGDGPGTNADELPAPSTRFYRLTHAQWENTVQDLLRLDAPTGFSEGFRSDPASAGYIFSNGAATLEVDQVLWTGYQRASMDTAQLVVSSEAILANLLPPEGGDEAARADAFVRDFGLRAFRRPLSEDEVASYVGLFAAAPALYDDSDGFDAGVRLVIESVLQSPNFIYRIERSMDVQGDVIALDDFEVAQRLSYLLTDSMPDDELLDVALEGSLAQSDVLEDQARRLLGSPRAQAVVQNFHHALFKVDGFAGTAPNPTVYPNAPAELGAFAQAEFDTFLNEVVLGEDGGLRALLSSNVTYVNADLATIYGIEGAFDDTFVRVELDDTTRRGVLTQVGFLAANATSVDPDPIHRGAFISERVLCAEVPAPPDDIPALPDVAGMTNREAIEELTEQPGSNCAGCHKAFINPFGFPFENYDSIGAFRTTDDGQTVDPATTLFVDGEEHPVANALELTEVLVNSEAAHGCYAKHWVEYAAGRRELPEDQALVERLGALSLDTDASLQDLIVEVVTSKPFLTRSAVEQD